nr:ribbon-helix-helix protein, CopG family [Salinibacter ruber]
MPRAAGAPHPAAKPTRPRQVRTRSEALADALRPELSSLDIEVEAGQVPLADEALKGRLQNLARQEGKSTSDVVRSLVQHYVRDRDRAEGRLSWVLSRPPW